MRCEIDLANRWKSDTFGYRGILVHDLKPASKRFGISYYEGAGCLLSRGINTRWEDRTTEDAVQDAKDLISRAGADVVGEITVPIVNGEETEWIAAMHDLGYFYLLVSSDSHAKMVATFKAEEGRS